MCTPIEKTFQRDNNIISFCMIMRYVFQEISKINMKFQKDSVEEVIIKFLKSRDKLRRHEYWRNPIPPQGK